MDERARRLAKNETIFREVNERVSEVVNHFLEVEARGEKVEFICECGGSQCTEPISMTLVEYEAVRADPTRFAVVPQDELPEIETAVERHPNSSRKSQQFQENGLTRLWSAC